MAYTFDLGGGGQQPLSMALDRSQTITSQGLNGVEWGVTNNKPPVDYSFKNKTYTPNNPFINRNPVGSQYRTDYQPQTTVDPNRVALANKYIKDNHSVLAGASTGIDKANHDDVSSRLQNIVNDVGNGTVSPEQAQEAMKNDSSWRPGAEWSGIAAGAMALLSGGNASDVYNASKQASNQASQSNIMANNRAELEKQFTPDSIDAAIQSGDRGMLVRRSLSLEEQQAAQQAENERQDQRDFTKYKYQSDLQAQREEAQDKRNQANQLATEERQAQRAKQDADKATADQLNKDRKAYSVSTNDFMKTNVKPNYFFTNANGVMDKAQALIDKGDFAAAGKLIDSATAEYEKGNVGGNRSITGEDIHENQKMGGVLQQMKDTAQKLQDGTMTKDSFNSMRTAMKTSLEVEHGNVVNKALGDYRNMVDIEGVDPKEAAYRVNQQILRRANVNALTVDQFEEQSTNPHDNEKPQGALTESTNAPSTTQPKAPGTKALPRNKVSKPSSSYGNTYGY